MTPKAYLRDLAERLMHVPVMYGVDQGDCDTLMRIANQLGMIADIAEGSTTANSLPHIAKLVKEDLDA